MTRTGRIEHAIGSRVRSTRSGELFPWTGPPCSASPRSAPARGGAAGAISVSPSRKSDVTAARPADLHRDAGTLYYRLHRETRLRRTCATSLHPSSERARHGRISGAGAGTDAPSRSKRGASVPLNHPRNEPYNHASLWSYPFEQCKGNCNALIHKENWNGYT